MNGPTMASASLLTAKVQEFRDLVPGISEKKVEKALEFASSLYGSRQYELLSETTLFEHAVSSSLFLAEFCPDEDAILSCILQHALKVPDAELSEISKEFGRTVRDMVSRIHLLSHLHTGDFRKSVDDMKIMLVSVSDDARVLLITLAVACSLLRSLSSVHAQYRMRLCRHALQLFAPVAARLGIYALKYQLERAAFPECYPTDAQLVERQLKSLHDEHGAFLNKTSKNIAGYLQEEGITADVMAREKQPYSIFQKMNEKSVTSLEKITDLFAIRVVVPTVADCYQSLGILHRLGTPLAHRFKDYISFPKPNGYQSLHTCLMGLPGAPKDVMVEVQIRTKEMHSEAEYGIAAHWLYKEKGKGKVLKGVSDFVLSDVLLRQHSVDSSKNKGKDDLALVDHMYVLTPKGDILELPDGATPLDFAFMVHTDVGLKYKSAKVNGSIVPIAHRLENGDVVEIILNKEPRPALHWIEKLKTQSARSKLKAYFFSHNRAEFLLKGRDAVNAELKTRKLAVLDDDLTQLSLFAGKSLSHKEREDLLARIGMGSMRVSAVFRHFEALPKTSKPPSQKRREKKSSSRELDPILFDGPTLPYRFAKCCSADTDRGHGKIVGTINRGGAVLIHKDSCRNAKGVNPARKIKVKWR